MMSHDLRQRDTWQMAWAKELTFMERENLRSWGHDIPEPPTVEDLVAELPEQTGPDPIMKAWSEQHFGLDPEGEDTPTVLTAPQISGCEPGLHSAACTETNAHGGLCGKRARK